MDLQDTLKPGKQVELSIREEDGDTRKLKTLVEKGYTNDSFTVIAPILEGNYYPLHPNDKLEVTFDVTEGEQEKKKAAYTMKVMVLERKRIDGQSVVIFSKISSPKKIQRRNTYRLHILKNVTYEYLNRKKVILLKNISATGLRGIIEERIPFDTEVNIHLDLENGETMDIKSKVVACDQVSNSMIQHDLRLQFIDLDNSDKLKLNNFINRKQSEALKKTVESEGRSKLEDMFYSYENNRRHGGDRIVQTVPILGLITWFMTLAIIALIVEARPEAKYNLDIYFNFYKRGYWRADLLTTAFVASLVEMIVCSVGLYMNSLRMKREGDQYNRGLIINLVFSILIMFLYIILPIGR
ncbi:flagellar brake protein [Fusibacter sp. JL216-2]|uniref:flagellar brake protein n=1 Tax=Fusibacter sp. JL216-2 TaxID=3071453 RepID=UPI003D356188